MVSRWDPLDVWDKQLQSQGGRPMVHPGLLYTISSEEEAIRVRVNQDYDYTGPH